MRETVSKTEQRQKEKRNVKEGRRNKKMKNYNFNIIKNEQGITLVALVVTIIILIILATVAINFAFGSNGLIRRAEDARDYYANDTAYTDESMANVESYLDELISGVGGGDTVLPADGSFSEAKGVNTPKLGANMDLVVFAKDRNEWIVDSTNTGYSYKEQTGTTENGGTSEWANAKVTTQVGDQTIESYFVWIPRYAYKIDSTNQTIDIKFIKGTGKETVDGTPCKYASEKPTEDDYIVHPAFTDEVDNGGWDSQIAGIWVGKYETSSVEGNSNSTGDNVTTKTAQVRPGVSSWRNIEIANMFTVAKAYAPNLESHMLKNSEWGAVAYLTESRYGRNGTEVTINNNGMTNFTGGGDNNAYVTKTNQSSTGNVYGIYDLSGNAYEYVAAGYSNRSEIETTNGSTKYATVYAGDDVNADYKYGDATHETSGWHSDNAGFVLSTGPFFRRGGNWGGGAIAGVFYFGGSGSRDNFGTSSFRLALVV